MAHKHHKHKKKRKQRYFDDDGAWMSYLRVYIPNHPKADIAGFVGKHILVMEEKLERPLRKGELVHHKDFHKPNNEPENLQNMTRKEHQQIPAMQARFLSENGLMDKFFDWWKDWKHEPVTPIQQAEKRLTKAENQRERMKAKLRKQENASDS